MATTVSNILKDSLVTLGQLKISVATGGTTVTVVDSGLEDSAATDDDLNGGTKGKIRKAWREFYDDA